VKPVVFIPEAIADSGLDLLRAECECLLGWEGVAPADRATLYGADAVIVRLFTIDEGDIFRAKRLKVVAKHGVGLDNIDIEAATTAGIPVVYTPTANANAVAEHTLTMMLALCRQIAPASAALREGRFEQRSRYQGVELAGKTLGILGLGRIGSRVAQMAASGLQMKVLAYDPYLAKDSYSGPAILIDSLETLLKQADFLSLHVELTPETRHLIDGPKLDMVKATCRLVNTSRGAVIDEEALVRALEAGRLAGAALDVFEEEPLPADHPLLSAPNTLLTPHISSSTSESLERMSVQAAQGVLDVFQGVKPRYLANPAVLL
jgi:D-3-phosphoglycerate dehydrogenase